MYMSVLQLFVGSRLALALALVEGGRLEHTNLTPVTVEQSWVAGVQLDYPHLTGNQWDLVLYN